MFPRSVGEMSRQEGSLNAFRAAATAVSTSSGVAAYTEAISDSSLWMLESAKGIEAEDVRGIDGSYFLSTTTLYPFVIDEETCWLGIFPAIGSRELDAEIRHLECRTSKVSLKPEA